MTGWPLLPPSMIDALGAQAAASPWPQWAWRVDRDETAWVNEAALTWLRATPAELASAAVMHGLIERRQAGNAPLLLALDLFAVTAQPLRREWLLGHERSDPEAPCVWQELTRLRVQTADGELLLFRVRPAADHEVLLAHGGRGGEPETMSGSAGLGVAHVDATGGLHWQWRDGWFARLPSADAPADAIRSVEATARGGLALFDALLVVQAVHQQEATTWTVMVDLPPPGDAAPAAAAPGAGVPWRLNVQPRPGTSACLLGLLPPPVEEVDIGLPWRSGPSGTPPVPFQCRADARLVFLSEDWPLLLGVPRAEALGRRLTDFCPPPLDTQGLALLEPVLSGREKDLRLEWPFRHADGDWRWLEVRLRPAPGGGDRAVGTLVDITERCRSRQLERIVATALEHTVNGVVITDATRAENPIVHVNRGFTRLSGYGADEVLGRNCNFLQGDDRAQPEIGVIARAIRDRQAVSVTLRNYRKDGTLFWNQLEISPVTEPVTGLVTHFLALQTDVTLKRRAEEANLLRALELERVFRGSPMGMVTFDPEGRIHLLSPPFLKLVGLQAAALLGRDAAALREAVAHRVGVPLAVLPWPESGQHVSWKLPGPPERVIDVSLSALGRDGGERIAFFRDVTDEQTEIATRSRFLATAAHELRTPLGSICGFTELMLVRNYTREQARPMLETVLRQAMRLSALLNDLLDLSQMDTVGAHAFPLGPVDLGEVMQRAVQVVLVPGGGREIRVTAPPASTWVTGHAAKLEQVLINLLSNALKYSPDGGPVSLAATPDHEGIAVAVTDQGLGLSEAQQAKLFTRFFRADPSGPIPGTGLGLVIVKELVERMGGRVEVRSRLGEGSTFTVHLRFAPAPGPAGLAPPAP